MVTGRFGESQRRQQATPNASLHDFTGGGDGGEPVGNISIDGNGNLWGTTSVGRASNKGPVWEITP